MKESGSSEGDDDTEVDTELDTDDADDDDIAGAFVVNEVALTGSIFKK